MPASLHCAFQGALEAIQLKREVNFDEKNALIDWFFKSAQKGFLTVKISITEKIHTFNLFMTSGIIWGADFQKAHDQTKLFSSKSKSDLIKTMLWAAAGHICEVIEDTQPHGIISS